MRAVVAYAAKDLRIEEVATPDVGPKRFACELALGHLRLRFHYSTTAVLALCACASQ